MGTKGTPLGAAGSTAVAPGVPSRSWRLRYESGFHVQEEEQMPGGEGSNMVLDNTLRAAAAAAAEVHKEPELSLLRLLRQYCWE